MHARSLHPRRRGAVRALRGTAAVGLGLLLSGCSGSEAGLGPLGRKSEPLRAEAFASATESAPAAPLAMAPPPPAVPAAPPTPESRAAVLSIDRVPTKPPAPVIDTPTASGAGRPPMPLVTTAGPGPTPNPAASPVAGGIVIDSLVGQINGKPVFASEVLEPLDGKLRATAEASKDPSGWRRKAAEDIVGELRRRIEDELILAEARRSLTPEQRQGLFRFLRQVQESMVSQRSGSEVAADEQIQRETGRTLRQESQDVLDKELIRTELQRRVYSRVIVSWRDVQSEYERRVETYNPPAEYTFRMIYATTDRAGAVAGISGALASGTPFADVARGELNEFNRPKAGAVERTSGLPQAESEFSPVEEINAAMRRAQVGQVLGPIVYAPDKSRPGATRTAWVYLEKIDRPEGVSLYDAQLEVEQGLLSERRGQEGQRYFDRLFKRGNISKIEVMAEQLMNIATDRYAPRFSKR